MRSLWKKVNIYGNLGTFFLSKKWVSVANIPPKYANNSDVYVNLPELILQNEKYTPAHTKSAHK